MCHPIRVKPAPVIRRISFSYETPNYITEWHSYSLGLGPCGKTVTHLKTQFFGDMFEVVQTCDDGTSDKFIYKIEDIRGRIKIERVSNAPSTGTSKE